MTRAITKSSATWMGISSIIQWAIFPTLTKMAGDVPPFQMTGVAFSIAFTMMVIYWLKNNSGIITHFKMPLPLMGLGIWGLFGFHFCYFFALQKAPPLDAFLIIEMWPILLMLAAVIFAHEKLHLHQTIGALLGFAGVITVATKGEFSGFSTQYAEGYALAAAAAVTWAVYSALSKRYAAYMHSDTIGVFCGLSAVLSLLCHWQFETWHALNLTQWAILIAMGIGPVGIAFFTWNIGMKYGNITLLGILSLGIPLLGTLILTMFGYGEFTRSAMIATVLVVAGGAIGSGFWQMLGKNPKPNENTSF
jgi:drug/metabolite transporter (DMT)-like permease